MHLVLCALLVTLAGVENTGIGPSIVKSTPGSANGTLLKQITAKPVDRPVTFTKNSEECQCIPYYQCNLTVDSNNVWITGWEKRNETRQWTNYIRLGGHYENPCPESIEVCCTVPKHEQAPRPKPSPSERRGCGYRNPKGVGGFSVVDTETQFGEFPWVVAVLGRLNGSYVGAGVLIHPQVVMTAAWVIAKYTPGTLKIRAGEWDSQTTKEIFDHQERDVREIYIHNEYHKKLLHYNIALLRLEEPFQLLDHVNTICLPAHNEGFNSSGCITNGWGMSQFNLEDPQERHPVILKRFEQNMVPHERCNMLLKRTRLGPRFNLHSSFVCAGGEGHGADKGDSGAPLSCPIGDRGAPLACPIGDNRYKLSGLVAWGIACGQKDVPAVYASVPAFRNWVDAKMHGWGYGTSTYDI